MTTAAILDKLQRRGVDIQSDGDKLEVDALKGAITANLRAELAEHKSELLELLKPKTGRFVPCVRSRRGISKSRPQPPEPFALPDYILYGLRAIS